MMKLRQTAGVRRSSRLRAKRYNEPPVSHALQPLPVETSPTHSAARFQPARTKRQRSRKRSQADPSGLKGKHCAKKSRRSPPLVLELSEKNLQRLDREVMNSAAKKARALKHSVPRRSIPASSKTNTAPATSATGTVRSKRSTESTAKYRYKHLKSAEVYIHTVPPANIQDAIDAVVKAKVSKERRAELCAIAQTLHDGCQIVVRNTAAAEDDFLSLFDIALKAMDISNLCLRPKADWRAEIKPTVQLSELNVGFAVDFNAMPGEQQHLDDASAPPQQLHANLTHISMPPPPAPHTFLDKATACSIIKTPRPDISIGIIEEALLSALESQNLNNVTAKRFIYQLQNTLKYRERGGPPEPLLMVVPTDRPTDLVFPFAVVEAKAYSTGKQFFEAENQAAVAGASSLKIQLCLNELVESTTTGSDVSPELLNTFPPLFFSICTEGPYHELYAHYTLMKDGVRTFNQTLLEICNAMLLQSTVDFLVAVDNVLRWGTGQFMESVVERLGKVAKKAGN